MLPMSKDFDILSYLMGKQDGGGGGGGGDITVVSKSIDANGTYTAPSGKAYSPVIVDVPNSYTAGDEGKVVSNGALVAQTAHAEVTQNGTIDTTLNNSVTVNVSGGGGALTFYTGTFTPASDTASMVITGLDAPAMIIRFGVTENATDGVTKITAGLYAGGAFAMSRTNANGTVANTAAYLPAPDNVFLTRTVYNDGSAPSTENRIFVTKTGFVIRAQSNTYGFKAGYTYKWECYTYPES